MAKQYWLDVTVTIGTAVLTDHAIRATVELNSDAQESTAFGDTWRKRLGGGLKDGSVTLDFHQDFATGSVNPVIATAFGGTANVIIGARDHQSLLLRIADRRAAERAAAEARLALRGYCESGCTAPVVTDEPTPLCAKCAARMLA